METVLHWWRCPRTIEAAVDEFEQNFLTDGAREWMRSNWPMDLRIAAAIDLGRMIGYRYGLVRKIKLHETHEDWAPSWNSRLIREGGGEAQSTAYQILARIHDRIRERHTSTD